MTNECEALDRRQGYKNRDTHKSDFVIFRSDNATSEVSWRKYVVKFHDILPADNIPIFSPFQSYITDTIPRGVTLLLFSQSFEFTAANKYRPSEQKFRAPHIHSKTNALRAAAATTRRVSLVACRANLYLAKVSFCTTGRPRGDGGGREG